LVGTTAAGAGRGAKVTVDSDGAVGPVAMGPRRDEPHAEPTRAETRTTEVRMPRKRAPDRPDCTVTAITANRPD
jgi:hypothetical protein